MNKLVVLLAVLLSLLLAQAGQTADLQAGWYANIRSVNIYTYDYRGVAVLRGGGYFYSTPPGHYWPFQVTDQPCGNALTRQVLVQSGVSGVGEDRSLELPLVTGMLDTDRIAYLSVWWETNYDPTQMLLQLVQKDDGKVLWQQDRSGEISHSEHMGWDALAGSLVFRVAVVPEPSSCISLLLPVSVTGLGLVLRRPIR